MSIPIPIPKKPVPPVADVDDSAAANSQLVAEAPVERLHPILTNDEVLAAREKARTRLAAERRKDALKAVEEQELEALKHSDGMIVGNEMDEIVACTIDLPEFAPNITVNGQPYWHGRTYDMPRHVAASLMEQQQNCWNHQRREFDGKVTPDSYRRQHLTKISPRGSTNLPKGAAA